MQRPFRHFVAVIILGSAALCAIGCSDEGVGDPCIPEAIPCDSSGKNCGYKASEFEELGIVFEPVMVLTTIEYKTKLAEAFDAGYRKAETAGVWW